MQIIETLTTLLLPALANSGADHTLVITCRGDSSGVQGSGTDAGPNPRAKKIKVQMGDEMQDAPEGRNLTEAERRRIRRSASKQHQYCSCVG